MLTVGMEVERPLVARVPVGAAVGHSDRNAALPQDASAGEAAGAGPDDADARSGAALAWDEGLLVSVSV